MSEDDDVGNTGPDGHRDGCATVSVKPLGHDRESQDLGVFRLTRTDFGGPDREASGDFVGDADTPFIVPNDSPS